MLKKFALIAAAILTVLCVFSCSEPEENLKILALKVGKADCFVVLTKNGCTVIDTGEAEDSGKIIDALRDNGVKKVDNLIITHFDKDHVGGAAGLLGRIEVANVYTNDRKKDSDEYKAFIGALGTREQKKVQEITRITQDALSITLYPPSRDKYPRDDSNNSSLAAVLEFEGKKLIFLADALDERMTELEQQGVITKCDLLKIPHHGQAEAGSERMI
ncbi:MAG: MBL fold metallo-hydrolase [Clostridia bacterium]|nr:MBL fold metallo-hydrolase [Clostridia bacterium]